MGLDTTMLNWFKSLFRTKTRAREYYPLSRLPDSFFPPKDHHTDSPLSLSPFWAALRLFQRTVGSLPLVTYRDQDGGRERAKTHPAYYLLHDIPNPSMTRATFWEVAIRDLFLRGECFIQVIWAGNGKPKMLLPVPHGAVHDVVRLEDWTKEYYVRTVEGLEKVPHTDMIHIMNFPDERGLRGVSLEHYATEALGLHKQVQEAGTAFFKNAVRPSNYVSWPGKIAPESANTLIEGINERHQGAANRGKVFWLSEGGKLEPVSDQTAEEARIVEMLSASVADIARWFGVSPGDIGAVGEYHYATLDADRAAYYTRCAMPLLDKIELAVNGTLFGYTGGTYAEFLVEKLLRGDPTVQADIDTKYIQAGVYTRQEVRRWKNLPDIPGLDTPTVPLNMGGNPELTTITGGTNEPAEPGIATEV